jgi:hypothetical protein
MRILKVVLPTTAAFLLLAASAVAALPSTWTGNALRVRPASITYTGDGSAFLAGRTTRHCRTGRCTNPLRWTSYAATAATATGADWVDDCTPDCARGKFHPTPTTVRMFRARQIHGHLVFTRMRVSDHGVKPRTFPLLHVGSSFTW